MAGLDDRAALAAAQDADTAAYERTPYPTLIHPSTHPDRLAVVARLVGMDPPDLRTARVLEVGVGNGFNLLAMAQPFPDARFTGIDIDALAIGVGQGWIEELGAHNVTLLPMDLLDAVDRLAGPFDYIIAHGVYAWVPAPVAEALLALIGRLLAPQGVACVSFNTLPGCYLRLALRDAMLRAIGDATDHDERMARARTALERLAGPDGGDAPMRETVRKQAKETLARADVGILIHDELNPNYTPAYLHEVIARAGVHGLDFLGDSSPELITEALLPRAVDPAANHQRQLEQLVCDGDEADFCQFRRMLLVRAGAAPARVFSASNLSGLYAASDAVRHGVTFARGRRHVQMPDPALGAALDRLAAAWPGRLAVPDLGLDPDRLRALVDLSAHDMLALHSGPAPFATVQGACPTASLLAAWMARAEMPWLATLDHRVIKLDPVAVAALLVMDGKPDEGRLAAALAAGAMTSEQALTAMLNEALFVA